MILYLKKQQMTFLKVNQQQEILLVVLTTIEEKAFGNFQKIGSCKFIDVLEPAEEPTKGQRFVFYGYFICGS